MRTYPLRFWFLRITIFPRPFSFLCLPPLLLSCWTCLFLSIPKDFFFFTCWFFFTATSPSGFCLAGLRHGLFRFLTVPSHADPFCEILIHFQDPLEIICRVLAPTYSGVFVISVSFVLHGKLLPVFLIQNHTCYGSALLVQFLVNLPPRCGLPLKSLTQADNLFPGSPLPYPLPWLPYQRRSACFCTTPTQKNRPTTWFDATRFVLCCFLI